MLSEKIPGQRLTPFAANYSDQPSLVQRLSGLQLYLPVIQFVAALRLIALVDPSIIFIRYSTPSEWNAGCQGFLTELLRLENRFGQAPDAFLVGGRLHAKRFFKFFRGEDIIVLVLVIQFYCFADGFIKQADAVQQELIYAHIPGGGIKYPRGHLQEFYSR